MGSDSSKINCVTVRVAACLTEKGHCLTTPNATDAEIRKAYDESDQVVKSFAHTFHGAGYHYFEYIWRVMEREHLDKCRMIKLKIEKKKQERQQSKIDAKSNTTAVPAKKKNDDGNEKIADVDNKTKEHHEDEKKGPVTRLQKKMMMNSSKMEDVTTKKKVNNNVVVNDHDGDIVDAVFLDADGIGRSWSIISDSEKHN